MNILCVFNFHNWNGCTCIICGRKRNINHDWNRCTCRICKTMRNINHDWTYNSHNEEYCRICGNKSGKSAVLIITTEMYEDISYQKLRNDYPTIFNYFFSKYYRENQIDLNIKNIESNNIKIELFHITSSALCNGWLNARQTQDSGSYYVLSSGGEIKKVEDGFYFQGAHFMGQPVSEVILEVGIENVEAIIDDQLDCYSKKITIVPFDNIIKQYAQTCFNEGL